MTGARPIPLSRPARYLGGALPEPFVEVPLLPLAVIVDVELPGACLRNGDLRLREER